MVTKNLINILKRWKHKDAAKKVLDIAKLYGTPSTVGRDIVIWNKTKPFNQVYVKDESITHNFPVKHKDFLYSTKTIFVNPKYLDNFGRISGSISYDPLKKEVTARCQMLVKNAVTLGFVEDVARGKIRASKNEYARRIKNNIIPKWYKKGNKI